MHVNRTKNTYGSHMRDHHCACDLRANPADAVPSRVPRVAGDGTGLQAAACHAAQWQQRHQQELGAYLMQAAQRYVLSKCVSHVKSLEPMPAWHLSRTQVQGCAADGGMMFPSQLVTAPIAHVAQLVEETRAAGLHGKVRQAQMQRRLDQLDRQPTLGSERR